MTFMGHGKIATVRNITVTTDTNDQDPGTLVAAAGIAPGTHSYSLNLNTVNERILKTPGIKKSATRRLPNGNLAIRTVLYYAVAEWTDGTSFYPLSADGTIVKKPSQSKTPGTVLFRGTMPNDISDITKAAMNLVSYIDYIEMIDNRRWNLYTTGGITVMLPESDPTAAIGTLVALNEQHRILSKDIKILDMRDGARILVK